MYLLVIKRDIDLVWSSLFRTDNQKQCLCTFLATHGNIQDVNFTTKKNSDSLVMNIYFLLTLITSCYQFWNPSIRICTSAFEIFFCSITAIFNSMIVGCAGVRYLRLFLTYPVKFALTLRFSPGNRWIIDGFLVVWVKSSRVQMYVVMHYTGISELEEAARNL